MKERTHILDITREFQRSSNPRKLFMCHEFVLAVGTLQAWFRNGSSTGHVSGRTHTFCIASSLSSGMLGNSMFSSTVTLAVPSPYLFQIVVSASHMEPYPSDP